MLSADRRTMKAFVCVLMFLAIAASPCAAAAQNVPASPSAGDNCQAIAKDDAKLDLIAKLCDFAFHYRHQLPDFIVQRKTTSEGMSKTVMTAQVTYQRGLENYSQVTIDGRPAPANSFSTHPPSSMQFSSTGEFGPALLDLFKVPGATEFKFIRTATLENEPVAVYEFRVPQKKNVFWIFRLTDGRSCRPEFTGELWLRQQTGEPLREQMTPVNLPATWDITSAKTVIDYSRVAIADAGTFILPVKSEFTLCNLGVFGMGACTTNMTVFHGYRKFGITTRIVNAPDAQ